MLFEHSVSVARDQPVGTNGRSSKVQVYGQVRCLVLPMSTSVAIQNNFSLGRAFTVFFKRSADIKVGDRLTWDGTNLFVRYIQDYNTRFVPHLEAMCEAEGA